MIKITKFDNYAEVEFKKYKTLMSLEDLHIIEDFPTWNTRSGYVIIARNIKTKYGSCVERLYLHRVILVNQLRKKLQGYVVDHKNRDKMDNRRENLRVVNQTQNRLNQKRSDRPKAGFYGVNVNIDKKTGKTRYLARIGKGEHLGTYDNPIDAAKRYDKEVRKRYGKYAFTNKDYGFYKDINAFTQGDEI